MAAAGMACLAAAWWVSLALDTALGRTGWLFTLLAAGGLLLWAALVWHWAKGLRAQPARCLYWHAIHQPEPGRSAAKGTRWRDEQNEPIDVRVMMDFGDGMLLSIRPLTRAGRPAGAPQWRWVGPKTLRGPWRWRLMANARHSSLPADEKLSQPMVASLMPCASQKATLPKSARRSA